MRRPWSLLHALIPVITESTITFEVVFATKHQMPVRRAAFLYHSLTKAPRAGFQIRRLQYLEPKRSHCFAEEYWKHPSARSFAAIPNGGEASDDVLDKEPGSAAKIRAEDGPSNPDPSSSGHSNDTYNPVAAVKHQVEHRATEKGGIELSRLLAERAVEASGERIAERVSEKGLGSLGRAKVGERIAEHVGDGLGRLAKAEVKAGERIAEHVGEKGLFRRLAKVDVGRLAKVEGAAGEKLAERIGEKGIIGRLVKAEVAAGERLTERIGEKGVGRLAKAEIAAGEKLAERIGEKGVGRLAKAEIAAGEKLVEHMGESGLGRLAARERLAVSVGINSEKGMERISERVIGRTIRRMGRGLLVALPALGGIFALWLYRADFRRSKNEQSRDTKLLFQGAAAGDAVDAACHFLIAYAILKEWDHSLLVLFEKFSVICAIASTFFAVGGEILGYRRLKRKQPSFDQTCRNKATPS